MVDRHHCFDGINLRVSILEEAGKLEDGADCPVRRTCTSSMYTTTYSQLMTEFNCSQEVATLGLSFFIWGLGS